MNFIGNKHYPTLMTRKKSMILKDLRAVLSSLNDSQRRLQLLVERSKDIPCHISGYDEDGHQFTYTSASQLIDTCPNLMLQELTAQLDALIHLLDQDPSCEGVTNVVQFPYLNREKS